MAETAQQEPVRRGPRRFLDDPKLVNVEVDGLTRQALDALADSQKRSMASVAREALQIGLTQLTAARLSPLRPLRHSRA